VRYERRRKSRVFVTGGRIDRHATLSATSTILPSYIFYLKFIPHTHDMATPNGNPSLETPPSFQSAAFTQIRQGIIAQGQAAGIEIDDEGAANQLLEAWETDRAGRQVTWNEAVETEERERAEAEAERSREENKLKKAEEKKKKRRFPTLTPGLPPPKDTGFRPCRAAIAKLENVEFVELWFFTFAGCQATKTITQLNPRERKHKSPMILIDGKLQTPCHPR